MKNIFTSSFHCKIACALYEIFGRIRKPHITDYVYKRIDQVSKGQVYAIPQGRVYAIPH